MTNRSFVEIRLASGTVPKTQHFHHSLAFANPVNNTVGSINDFPKIWIGALRNNAT